VVQNYFSLLTIPLYFWVRTTLGYKDAKYSGPFMTLQQLSSVFRKCNEHSYTNVCSMCEVPRAVVFHNVAFWVMAACGIDIPKELAACIFRAEGYRFF
jgi:hypothetical protein